MSGTDYSPKFGASLQPQVNASFWSFDGITWQCVILAMGSTGWGVGNREHWMGYEQWGALDGLWATGSTGWAMSNGEHGMGCGQWGALDGVWATGSTGWGVGNEEHGMGCGHHYLYYF